MNVKELRDLLTERLHMLKNGETDAKNANAIAHVASKVMSSVKLEMEYAKMHGKVAHIDFMGDEEQANNS